MIFKSEKEISRSLEFDGMWIAEHPADDDFRGHWDKIVISTRSFPDKYWDKFVKKKVSSAQLRCPPEKHPFVCWNLQRYTATIGSYVTVFADVLQVRHSVC